MIRVGKKIKQLRKMKNLTQKDFSEITNITYRHFQNIEADKSDIRLSTAQDIADGLMIPIQTLFDKNHCVDLIGSGIMDTWQILDLSPIGICIANFEGRIVYLNHFFKTNLICQSHITDLKKCYVWDLLPSEKKDQGKLDFYKVIREKLKPKPGRRVYLGPGKKEIEVIIYWNYILDSNKNTAGFVSFVLPIPQVN